MLNHDCTAAFKGHYTKTYPQIPVRDETEVKYRQLKVREETRLKYSQLPVKEETLKQVKSKKMPAKRRLSLISRKISPQNEPQEFKDDIKMKPNCKINTDINVNTTNPRYSKSVASAKEAEEKRQKIKFLIHHFDKIGNSSDCLNVPDDLIED